MGCDPTHQASAAVAGGSLSHRGPTQLTARPSAVALSMVGRGRRAMVDGVLQSHGVSAAPIGASGIRPAWSSHRQLSRDRKGRATRSGASPRETASMRRSGPPLSLKGSLTGVPSSTPSPNPTMRGVGRRAKPGHSHDHLRLPDRPGGFEMAMQAHRAVIRWRWRR